MTIRTIKWNLEMRYKILRPLAVAVVLSTMPGFALAMQSGASQSSVVRACQRTASCITLSCGKNCIFGCTSNVCFKCTQGWCVSIGVANLTPDWSAPLTVDRLQVGN